MNLQTPPTRGRELKFQGFAIVFIQILDAPHAGARIEMVPESGLAPHPGDAPHAGARIEISYFLRICLITSDAPHAGARIEIA